LWKEIYVCLKHLGIGYSDVMMMPTGERRFYLNSLIQERTRENERVKQISESKKGKRTTKIGGDALKTKIKSGEIPTT
jgi:hypothetical protein